MSQLGRGREGDVGRLQRLTGHAISLGRTGVSCLKASAITPAIEEMCRKVEAVDIFHSSREADLQSLIVGLQERVKVLEAHSHASLEIRLLKVPLETDNQAQVSSVSEDPVIPFFWHASSKRWWSVEVISLGHSRNATGYTGALRISTNAIDPTVTTQYTGYHLGADAALVGLVGSCANTAGGLPNDQEIDITINGAIVDSLRWTDGEIRMSHFYPLEDALDYDASNATKGILLLLSNTTPSIVPVALDRPRFETYFRYYRDDLGPPGLIPVDAVPV